MPAFSNSAEAVRKWISRSEASESELPPKEHRLPEGWDEEDIIVNEDVAPIQSAPSPKKKQAAPPAPVTAASPSPSKKSTAATKKDAAPEHTQVSSPGIFPEGFFASPKTQKPTGDFPVTAAAAAASPNKKKTDDEAPAPVKADAAAAASPSIISRLTGFLMRKQDGSASPKLTGKRREREESSSSSSSSDDEDEETSGGDLGSQLISMTPKQLEKSSAITIGDLKEFARENDISFNSKSKKADLVASCRTFAKKNAGNATAAGASSPSKPRAASSNSNTNAAASPAATATSASPQKAAKKKVRKINMELLTALPPVSVSKNDEPREDWACIQMKQWAKENRVDLSNVSLKTEILTKCWEAYDAKH